MDGWLFLWSTVAVGGFLYGAVASVAFAAIGDRNGSVLGARIAVACIIAPLTIVGVLVWVFYAAFRKNPDK